MEKKTKYDKVCWIAAIISILFVAWIFFSFIDTNIHNTSDLNYSGWNFFEIMLKLNGRLG